MIRKFLPSELLDRPLIADQKLQKASQQHLFYEFFAGGGMARAGLGTNWECVFANEIDEKKAESYRANWGKQDLRVKDVNHVTLSDLPAEADLSWASFPCQDLSLAGNGKGLSAERSGTFWPFWNLMRGLVKERRGPKLIVIENVFGALTSHDGRDFAAISSALSGSDYSFGAVVIDAVHFIPQSRPRLFIIGVRKDLKIPSALKAKEPDSMWHPKAVLTAFNILSKTAQRKWIWWNIPAPFARTSSLSDLIEDEPTGTSWHSARETKHLLSLMSPLNKKKVEKAKASGELAIGTLYKRTRKGQQRAEVRFDDVSGCLRTPAGGSSRQIILVVDKGKVRSRLLSTREAARLMGLDDDYKLPDNYNAAYHLAGDGVVVPVVQHIARHVLEPILETISNNNLES